MLKTMLLSLSVAGIFTNMAQAQIAAEHPRQCVMNVGPTQMMFSAFQENRTDEIFCQQVPVAGPTLIILDARQDELSAMTIEARVLRNVGQKDWRDDLDANTVTTVPAGKYLADRNTWSFRTNFENNGEYIAIVRARSDDGAKEYVGEYYFSVGPKGEWYAVGGMLATFVAVAGAGLWRRGKGVAPGKMSAGNRSTAGQST